MKTDQKNWALMWPWLHEQWAKFSDRSEKQPVVVEGVEPSNAERVEQAEHLHDYWQRVNRLYPNLEDIEILMQNEVAASLNRLFSPGTPGAISDYDRGVLSLAFVISNRIRNAQKAVKVASVRLGELKARVAVTPEPLLEEVEI